MASGDLNIDLKQKMTETVSGNFLQAFVCFFCDALRWEPRWGLEALRRLPADRVFRSIGAWRRLTDANVQQIIRARTFRFM